MYGPKTIQQLQSWKKLEETSFTTSWKHFSKIYLLGLSTRNYPIVVFPIYLCGSLPCTRSRPDLNIWFTRLTGPLVFCGAKRGFISPVHSRGLAISRCDRAILKWSLFFFLGYRRFTICTTVLFNVAVPQCWVRMSCLQSRSKPKVPEVQNGSWPSARLDRIPLPSGMGALECSLLKVLGITSISAEGWLDMIRVKTEAQNSHLDHWFLVGGWYCPFICLWHWISRDAW